MNFKKPRTQTQNNFAVLFQSFYNFKIIYFLKFEVNNYYFNVTLLVTQYCKKFSHILTYKIRVFLFFCILDIKKIIY